MSGAALGRVQVFAWAYAVLLSLGVGLFLFDIPIQVSDSYGNMLKLDLPWRELIAGEFSQRAFLRPFLWAELKLVYDLADGNYFAWFRGVHAVQVAVLAALFVHLARPRTWLDLAVLPFGLAVLIGSHTFAGAIDEAFPVNTFLTILVCCLAAAALSLSAYRWWHDVAAVLLFVLAALTVESGLLVAVILVAGAVVGGRGLSRPGVLAVATLFVGYFVLRFSILDVGSPGLTERASGFGFQVLEPGELQARFGDNPFGFYAYNVLASASSVLFAEPRAGVWRLLAGLIAGEPESALVISTIAAASATGVIAWYGWRRRAAWFTCALDHDDRLVLLFLAVLGANAAISYPYTKDVVMSPAGAFYALAAFAGVKRLLATMEQTASLRRAVAIGACCGVLGASWAIRELGAHADLRISAQKVRDEWVYFEGSATSSSEADDRDRRALALLRLLKHDAIIRRPAPPTFPLDTEWLDVK